MSSLLLCSTPVHGHVTPLLEVARALVASGHDLRFLTGARYRAAVEATGARWLPLPAEADFDDSDVDAAFPGRVGLRGPAGIRFDLREIFFRPARAQLAALEAALDAEPTDAVLAESMFFGILPLLHRPRSERPVVVSLGIVPLGLRHRDVAPFGLGITPRPGRIGRARNGLLQLVADRAIFASIQRDAERLVAECAGVPLTSPAFDYPALADAIVQFTVPAFEYPRPGSTAPVHFVGPVSRTKRSVEQLPAWWDELDGSRPVIHVTQGTVANSDLDDLVLPTLRALADEPVLVIATTGGRPVPDAQLPANARIERYVPYDRLLPHVDVFVTNGGYGGVHFALEHGAAVVVAGRTEDKAEVAARVAWSGVGVRLRSDRPAPSEIASAVRTALSDPDFRARAASIGAQIAASPGPAGIDDVLRELLQTPDA